MPCADSSFHALVVMKTSSPFVQKDWANFELLVFVAVPGFYRLVAPGQAERPGAAACSWAPAAYHVVEDAAVPAVVAE